MKILVLSLSLFLIPAATFAEEIATSVLVLTSGQAMKVRSYRVDGSMVRIKGPEGEALILRANKVDWAATEEATAQYEVKLQKEAEEEEALRQAEAAKAQAKIVREQKLVDRRRRPSHATGISVVTDSGASSSPSSSSSASDGSKASASDEAPGAESTQSGSDDAKKKAKDEAKAQIPVLQKQITDLQEKIANAQVRIRQFGDLSAHGANVKREQAGYEKELAEAREALGAAEEAAR